MLSKGKKRLLGVLRKLIAHFKANGTFFHITTSIKELLVLKKIVMPTRTRNRKESLNCMAKFKVHYLKSIENGSQKQH